jgi:hypothetical protein
MDIDRIRDYLKKDQSNGKHTLRPIYSGSAEVEAARKKQKQDFYEKREVFINIRKN